MIAIICRSVGADWRYSIARHTPTHTQTKGQKINILTIIKERRKKKKKNITEK